jgi:hypothetical protein
MAVMLVSRKWPVSNLGGTKVARLAEPAAVKKQSSKRVSREVPRAALPCGIAASLPQKAECTKRLQRASDRHVAGLHQRENASLTFRIYARSSFWALFFGRHDELPSLFSPSGERWNTFVGFVLLWPFGLGFTWLPMSD